MPEATHWFERDGEMICEAYYKTSILWSQTMIQNDTDRMPRLEDFEPRAHAVRGRARAREALRSIGQENLTSPRIPRTASLPLARQRRRRLPDVVGAGMGPGA
jgi:hypothetical protein